MPGQTTLVPSEEGSMRTGLVRRAPSLVLAAAAAVVWLALSLLSGGSPAGGPQLALPVPHPLVSDYVQLTRSETPPTQGQCGSAGRRCFNPASTRAAYNI